MNPARNVLRMVGIAVISLIMAFAAFLLLINSICAFMPGIAIQNRAIGIGLAIAALAILFGGNFILRKLIRGLDE